MPKSYSQTYLYSKYADYEKNIFKFLMNAEQISKADNGFDDIKYEVKKRQISNSLIRVLESKNVILLSSHEPLPKAFRVFVAKDIKTGKHDVKTFIDCSGLIVKTDKGYYTCNNIDILIAYLINAANSTIYNFMETKFINNNTIAESGAKAFSSLLSHIIDYVAKISTMSNSKNKCNYLAATYYLVNILGRDEDSQSVKAIAKKISGLSDREADIIDLQVKESTYSNIKFFAEDLSNVLKINPISVDILLEKWIYLYGPGTQFGLEFFPAFASMLTDAYVGCYINNQKTISNIAGRDMIEFVKTILSIGEGVA